ncbi:unnamed protein product [Dicrocoelium dendriticum]|nr:unnamed protein product [Dicrocoelium dendriticum]
MLEEVGTNLITNGNTRYLGPPDPWKDCTGLVLCVTKRRNIRQLLFLLSGAITAWYISQSMKEKKIVEYRFDLHKYTETQRFNIREIDISVPRTKVVLSHTEFKPKDTDESIVKQIFLLYPKRKQPRILCYLNTHPRNYGAKAIHTHFTWARRCTKHLYTSTKEDPVLPILKLNLSAPETRSHLWSKMRVVLRQIYQYVEEFEFFLKGDDDTFVIMENLLAILRKQSPDDPFMMGYWYPLSACTQFHP